MQFLCRRRESNTACANPLEILQFISGLTRMVARPAYDRSTDPSRRIIMPKPYLKDSYIWRFVVSIAVVLFAVVSCEDKPTEPETLTPIVTSYSDSSVAPGDTILVRGSLFSPTTSLNRVDFANPLARVVPISGSENSLTVVVPANAASGQVRVSIPGETGWGKGPLMEVPRVVGEGWLYGGTGAGYPLSLPFPATGSEYLVIPYAANKDVIYYVDNSYGIATEGATASPDKVARSSAAVADRLTGRERFDAFLHDQLMKILETSGGAVPSRSRTDISLSPQAPAQFRQFNVLNTADPTKYTTDAANYTQVTAMLRYNGAHCMIYNDVDTLATGNFTQADYNNFGTQFDTQIQPTNTNYFGTESDIDANGKVIILMSGVINYLPATDPQWDGGYFIGGFFSPVDLFPPGGGIQEGTTNEAEIFYVLAADPNGDYLDPKFKFTRLYLSEENPRTIAHEYQHLISMSYRLLQLGANYVQTTWLEEGMAHMAEDLNDMDGSNINRANGFLADPGGTSLEHPQAPLNQRGGIYLFLRYLGDRFGETIYKDLLHSRCVGRPCIEVITGENFYDTFGDFLATLYLSGRGITANPKYNFTSIDLEDFDTLMVNRRVVGTGAVSGKVKRTSGEFFLYTSPGSSAGTFTFSQSSRAGMRFFVLRTQ